MAQNPNPDELLKLFHELPARYKNHKLDLTMWVTPTDRFSSVDAAECLALDLPPGETVKGYVRLGSPPGEEQQKVYAAGEVAEALLKMRGQYRQLQVRARTLYTYVEPDPDVVGEEPKELKGVRIIEILESRDPGVKPDRREELELLKRLMELPGRYAGREVQLTMWLTPSTRISSLGVDGCRALQLPPGRTVRGYVSFGFLPGEEKQKVYATDEVAEELLKMEGQYRELRVRARPVYGYVGPEPLGRRAEEFSGLLIDQILEIQDPEAGRAPGGED